MYTSFEDLEVWKRSCVIGVEIIQAFENSRDYGIKDQMTRSAISIASNIAEGAERDSKKEFIRFLHIPKGSAGELRTQLYISAKAGVFPLATEQKLVPELKEISKMLQGLIFSINKQICEK